MKSHNHSTVAVMIAIYALESVAANLVHPVTPTLIDRLQFPSYMFGVLFAGMAFTNFLFSPFWGSTGMKVGSRNVLGLCCAGYALGQGLFGIIRDQTLIVAARMLSGAFVSGISVCTLTYLIAFSPEEEQGKNLTVCATVVTVGGALGYLAGGVIGDHSIPLTFAVQVILLLLCGVLFRFCLHPDQQGPGEKRNPAARPGFGRGAGELLAVSAVLVLAVVFITSFASTAYEQCLNYYMKDQLNFKPSYNGLMKALVGGVSLVTNLTICVWMIRSKRANQYLAATLGAGACFLILMTFCKTIVGFVLVNMVFFACNAIYIPLVQDACAQLGGREKRGVLMGAYNSLKSFGMIAGALFAGFLYDYGPTLPFFFSSLLFITAGGLTVLFILRSSSRAVGSSGME